MPGVMLEAQGCSYLLFPSHLCECASSLTMTLPLPLPFLDGWDVHCVPQPLLQWQDKLMDPQSLRGSIWTVADDRLTLSKAMKSCCLTYLVTLLMKTWP